MHLVYNLTTLKTILKCIRTNGTQVTSWLRPVGSRCSSLYGAWGRSVTSWVEWRIHSVDNYKKTA